MKEMSEQSRPAEDGVRNRRKRIAQEVLHIVGLAAGISWLLVFVVFVRTGYLSWIGITVGTLYVMPGLAAPLAGLAGKKRLGAFLSWLSAGEPLLVVLVVAIVSVWPERDEGSWKPYNFDAELAAMEARRGVSDPENAALYYDSALADIDVDDRPDFIVRSNYTHNGLAEIPWRSEDHPQASQWLDLHTEVIGRLLQIGELEKCRWPIYADSDCRWTVPYKKVSYGAWLLTVAGNRDLGEGRRDQALEKYLCLLRIADHLCQQTDDLDLRYAFHQNRAALGMLRHILVASELSAQEIERIDHRLPTAADTWHQDIARLLEFDELRFARFMASVYEINERGKVRFAASFSRLREGKPKQGDSFLEGRAWRLYWLMNMPRNPEDVWDMARKESTSLVGFLQPGPVLHAACADDDSFWSFLDFAGKTLSNLARWWAHDICFSEHLHANFGEYHAKDITQRRGTWLVLGLRRHRDAHGTWPATLDAISEYVPVEAFADPTSGDAFVYARDGDSFRLYSKGLNRVDEGGRQGYVQELDKVEDDIWLWPPPPPEPELPDEEADREMMQQLEEIFGKGYFDKLDL